MTRSPENTREISSREFLVTPSAYLDKELRVSPRIFNAFLHQWQGEHISTYFNQAGEMCELEGAFSSTTVLYDGQTVFAMIDVNVITPEFLEIRIFANSIDDAIINFSALRYNLLLLAENDETNAEPSQQWLDAMAAAGMPVELEGIRYIGTEPTLLM